MAIAAVDAVGGVEGILGDRTEAVKAIFADANDGEPGRLHGGDLFLGLRGLWYASEAENVGKSGEIPGLCRNCNARFEFKSYESEHLFLAFGLCLLFPA